MPQLSKCDSEDVKRRCAAALDALSCHPSVQARLVTEDVVTSLVSLVGTRDTMALLEGPHLRMPPLLGPPQKLGTIPRLLCSISPVGYSWSKCRSCEVCVGCECS